ncbi:hypothetical protein [Rhodanobacter denitrificans]|uniref:hypothetical protein n=1 Tax=Rhodanobacter denitrificans TaxID=666685 RepID=UPI001F3C079D|nr:hypothetical protein [Rhodanobacter denitrificans]UJJ60598.1 hypothetical protein LRK55_19380 [Rhodanobacter denitrificans]
MTATEPTATATAASPSEPRVEKVCAECGGTNVVMEAAVRWDVDAQEWCITTIYDKSGHCDDCDADVGIDDRELPVVPSLATYTVFVRQADGRGTTHVSSHDAASPAEAEQLALAETASDWEDSVDDLVVLGVIAGDVEIVSWDDDAWE